MTRQETKTIIMARYGMLECGTNYKGTTKSQCSACNVIDNEDHRLNFCQSWQDTNLFGETEKIPFDCIYSTDIVVLRGIIPKIEHIWNTRSAHGTMNKL